MTESQKLIAHVCDQVKNLLLEKNIKYGDSAINPCRVFSKSSAQEQILVRIDDKINRIMQGNGLLETDEDVVMDLIGYLVLYKVALLSDCQKAICDSSEHDKWELWDPTCGPTD